PRALEVAPLVELRQRASRRDLRAPDLRVRILVDLLDAIAEEIALCGGLLRARGGAEHERREHAAERGNDANPMHSLQSMDLRHRTHLHRNLDRSADTSRSVGC